MPVWCGFWIVAKGRTPSSMGEPWDLAARVAWVDDGDIMHVRQRIH
jgi:hypothetical protein